MFDHDLYKDDEPETLLWRWIAIAIACFIALLGLCFVIGWALTAIGLQDYAPMTISFLSLPMVWIGISKM